jgi:hypothetical protein
MTRYFFDLSGKFASKDTEGEEFPSAEAAAAEAREVAREFSHNRSEADMHGWRLRVTDETGAEIAVVAFSDSPPAYGPD